MNKAHVKIKIMLVIIMVMVGQLFMLASCTNIELIEAPLLVSGGDFIEVFEESGSKLSFEHNFEIVQQKENEIFVEYTIVAKGAKRYTIVAKGNAEKIVLSDGKEIYFCSLSGEVKINGKKYYVYANVDKVISGEDLFSSVTIQSDNGSKSCFFSIGTPIITIDNDR